MVLENAASQAAEDPSAEFTSMSDQPSSPRRQWDDSIALAIQRSDVPHTFSFFGPRGPHPNLKPYLVHWFQHITPILGRPLRQDEVDALTYHFAGSMRTASYGAPIGGMIGGVICYMRADTFRFPGYTPKSFNPDVFLRVLRGKNARFAWHSLRLAAYYAVGAFAGRMFLTSYGMTVSINHRIRDPRLKEFNDALVRHNMEKRGQLREVDQTPGPREGETYEMSRQRQSVQETLRRSRAAGHADTNVPPANDMSPTGGSFKEEFGSTGTDSGLLSDSQLQRQEQQEQRMRESRAATHDATGGSKTSYPDATSRTTSATQTQQSQSSRSTSSWDRLRERAGVRPPPPPTPVTQADDGLSFMQLPPSNAQSSPQPSLSTSSGDDRSDAQRAFDEQLERERNLDLGRGNNDRDKWA